MLLLVCLAMTLVQASAAARAIGTPPPDNPPAAIELIAGAAWAAAFAAGALRLGQGKPGALRLGFWLCVLFVDYTVIRLFLFAQADYDRGRLPALVAVAVLLTVSLWITDRRPALWRRQAGTRQMEKTL
ncbi:MAG: hypothetical protein IPK19_37385 [Chloroflexi bacterium]|nr:hypothetical protein [Chloroflexota bacterium]